MSAQPQLLTNYGQPDHEYIQKYCVSWPVRQEFPWFPVDHFLVNVDFRDLLRKAFIAVQTAGLQAEIKTFDGCYNDRSVRGSTAISLHAWAAAIDLNAACDGMVVNPTPEQRRGTWSPAFIAAMKGAGLHYGGDFIHRADPMHWGLFNG